jgi:hypothetical protein
MAAVENSPFTLTLTGTGFADAMELRIVGDNALTQGYVAWASTVDASDQGRRMVAAFDAANGLIKGWYRVEILNGGVVDDSLTGFRILAAGTTAPMVTQVSPDTAKSGRNRMVVVSGADFVDGASVVLIGGGNSYESSYVVVSDATTITAVIESGTQHIPVGDYELWVVNPDGMAGMWDQPFTVTDQAPPTILGIAPTRAGSAADIPFTVTGTDFVEGAFITLLGPTGDVPLPTTMATEGTVLAATIPTGLATGIYPVRVTNPDGQYDTYYFYQVSNNSPGSLTTFETMTENLNVPRWQHGLDAMIDGMGHGFLVVTGGLDASGVPIDDVEISQVSPNGAPGRWEIPAQTDPVTGMRITNRMNEPRSGAATVRVGKTLFVLGGRSLPDASTPAADSIEMARILSSSSAPRVRAPSAGTAGLLPAGRWLYKVSAVTPAGEGLASSTVSYRTTGGSLAISWEPIRDAVGYNIYRCPAANGIYGEEVAVAWMIDPALRSFTDTGDGTLTPSPSGIDSLVTPDNPGALAQTTYSYRITSLAIEESTEFESVPGPAHTVTVPGGAGMISLVWNDVPASDGYLVYRSVDGGEYALVAELEAGVTAWDDNLAAATPGMTPPAPLKPLPAGSLSLFEYPQDADGNQLLLNIVREGARATYVEMFGYDETEPAALAGIIVILGGRSAFAPMPESLATAETIPFFVDGTLGQPGLETVEMITGRSFFGLGNSQNRLENLAFEDDDDDEPVDPDCPDTDKDGFFDKACGGTDCDDANFMINPAAWEDLQNGIDDNCDGLVDVPTQGWGNTPIRLSGLVRREAAAEEPEPVFLIALFGNSDVLATGDTGRRDIEAVQVDLSMGHLIDINDTPADSFRLQANSDNGDVHGLNVALYQKYLFSFMGVGYENLGQVPATLNSQSKRFPYCPIPEPGDPGDSSFGCPGYTSWTYSDLAGVKRTSANATVSGGLGYYGLTRAFGYIYLVAGVGSSGVSEKTWRVLQ